MEKHSIMLITIITMAVLFFSLFTGCAETEANNISAVEQSNTNLPTNRASSTLSCRYYDRRDFMASVSSVSKEQEEAAFDSIGGIVPHHLLAGNMISDFFYQLSLSSPDTLIVLAPNHRKLGTSGVHTSKLSWGTEFGMLDANSDIVDDLIKFFKASQNSTIMEEEHSISSLVPYIKYYMPNVKIVPILLHGNNTKQESLALGEKLAEYASDNSGVSIIASVDFSHYLDAKTAKKMDIVTLEAIEAYDIDSVYAMDNDNLDSPPSVIALLSAMEGLNSSDLVVLDHGNSSDITGGGADYTTSYYTILFNR